MSEKPSALELASDKDYWQKTVGAVGQFLPKEYAEETLTLLKAWGVSCTTREVWDVRMRRNISNRVIAKALYEVALRYKDPEEQEVAA